MTQVTSDGVPKGPLNTDERVKLRRGIRAVERFVWLGRQLRLWIGFGIGLPATIVGISHSYQWIADKLVKLLAFGALR